MKQIRKNVFETNSSSSHSLTISPNTPIIDNTRKLNIHMDYFGWGYEEYNDIETKFNYLYTMIREYHYFDARESGYKETEKYKKYTEELKFFTDILDGLGVEYEINELENGSIDHQSQTYEYINKFKKDKDLLIRWLFNPESILYIDNDN